MIEPKNFREFICPVCGKTHRIDADYFIPGVSGITIDDSGKPVLFVDPNEPQACKACVDAVLAELEASDEYQEPDLYL